MTPLNSRLAHFILHKLHRLQRAAPVGVCSSSIIFPASMATKVVMHPSHRTPGNFSIFRIRKISFRNFQHSFSVGNRYLEQCFFAVKTLPIWCFCWFHPSGNSRRNRFSMPPHRSKNAAICTAKLLFEVGREELIGTSIASALKRFYADFLSKLFDGLLHRCCLSESKNFSTFTYVIGVRHININTLRWGDCQ